MYLRSHYYEKRLVIEIPYSNTIYFKQDDLLSTFLDGLIPIGIVLDYIEDHPDIVDEVLGRPKYNHDEIVKLLRDTFTEPTRIWKLEPTLYYNKSSQAQQTN